MAGLCEGGNEPSGSLKASDVTCCWATLLDIYNYNPSSGWDRTIKEAIEIKLEKNNFNRDSGLQLSQAWTPALEQLRSSYNQGHEDHGPRTATDSNRRNRARRPPNFTQESREGRSLRAMTIPGPGLADPPTNPVSPETA
ncbi:hypothetical protein ANN_24360 [Periplaneta americana]|uniref:Uncharacterized protein n=1 Tax=Periplaneta americana TaxID=6978 RepID=A0ABQ8S385_PERAM|nr:hypothetical protein ANN_24360 [Periplaneta americana]